MAGPEEQAKPRLQILVCDGPSCGVTYESELLKELIERRVAGDETLRARCSVVDYNCFGRCSEGPNIFVREVAPGEDPLLDPEPAQLETQRGFYAEMNEAKSERVVDEHCGRGVPVGEWVDDY